MHNSKTQSGSVVAYAIAAVVLLVLLTGAFYLAKHWAGEPSNQTANTPSQPAPQKTASNGSSSTGGQTKSQSKSDNSAPSAGHKSTQPRQGGASQPTTTTNPATRSNGSIAPAGPTDVIQTVAGLSVLTGAVVAYRRSLKYRQPV